MAPDPSTIPDIEHVIAVGAGKGGVGKSMLTVMLGIALARRGARVGILDGDIYGPSMPCMLGLTGARPSVRGSTLLPFEVTATFGTIKAISIGNLVETDKALIWRGPMAHGAFKQLALQTEWGALDYLLVDLPPGTGDVPLSLSQMLPLSGAVLACTPQAVAQDDARRAARMFEQLEVPILGLVENMSAYTDDSGTVHDLFGQGGAEALARTMSLPFLGAVPLHPTIRKQLDVGTPQSIFDNESLAATFDEIATRMLESLDTTNANASAPTLNIN